MARDVAVVVASVVVAVVMVNVVVVIAEMVNAAQEVMANAVAVVAKEVENAEVVVEMHPLPKLQRQNELTCDCYLLVCV